MRLYSRLNFYREFFSRAALRKISAIPDAIAFPCEHLVRYADSIPLLLPEHRVACSGVFREADFRLRHVARHIEQATAAGC